MHMGQSQLYFNNGLMFSLNFLFFQMSYDFNQKLILIWYPYFVIDFSNFDNFGRKLKIGKLVVHIYSFKTILLEIGFIEEMRST